MNNKYYKTPKSSWLMRQFWKAAGADRYLLERSTYSDQVKYFCLGGIVIATGAMAAMAGGYAMYMIFEPKGPATNNDIHMPTVLISTIFGIIWGLIIFNIDRFIVTSTGKGDGTEAITKQEFKSAIPRIVMGLIIALTISKPIEIRMFKSEIDAELEVIQDKKLLERKRDIDKLFDSKLEEEKKAIVKLEQETEKAYKDFQNAEATFNAEMDGDAGTAGFGPEAKKKEAAMQRYLAAFNGKKETNDALIKEINGKIEGFKEEKEAKNKKAQTEVDSLDGLLERLKLAHQIAGFWISLFITLLFIVIELTPIFFKMMLIKGPYDYMDENVKALALAESGIEVDYNFYKDEDGVEAHKVINHGAELKKKQRIQMIKAQDEINEKIINEWRKKKMKDVDDNIDDFIQD